MTINDKGGCKIEHVSAPRRTLLAISALTLLALCTENSDAAAWDNIPLGSAAPILSLPDLKGKAVRTVAAPAKALIILYFKAGQERSKKALVDLVKLRKDFDRQQLKVIAIAGARHDGIAKARALVDSLELPFIVLSDPHESYWSQAGLALYPTTGVVDSKGNLRYQYGGHRPDFSITIRRQLKAVLGLGPPPESIKDVDRQEIPPEARRERLRAKMKAMLARREQQRYRDRLIFARSLLHPAGLATVISAYDHWVAATPLPVEPIIRVVAAAISSTQPVATSTQPAAALETLEKFSEQNGPQQAEALLWLGRAHAKREKTSVAIQSFRKCLSLPSPLPQCAFELAKLSVGKSTEKALVECRLGYRLLLGPL